MAFSIMMELMVASTISNSSASKGENPSSTGNACARHSARATVEMG